MAFTKGKIANPNGINGRTKVATQQIISALNESYDGEISKLRKLVDVLIAKGCEGDIQAILAVFDRSDGKPAQESTVTIDDKRDATDWTRSELVAFLNEARASRQGVAEENGSGGEPDSVH